MATQQKLDEAYIKMAKIWGDSLSQAKRAKVGCLIVKDHQIISDGFNGTLPGDDNCCEDEHGNTKPNVIHSERNAIMKLAKTTNSAVGATLYCVYSPCFYCAQEIILAGIKRVVFLYPYRLTAGIELLIQKNIKVEMCDI